MNGMSMFLVTTGSIFAFIAGSSFYRSYSLWINRRQHRQLVQAEALEESSKGKDGCITLYDKVIEYMEALTRAVAIEKPHISKEVYSHLGKRFLKYERMSGLSGIVSKEAFVEAKLRLGILIGLAALVVGLIFSTELGVALFIAGFAFGWMLPQQAVKHRMEWRTVQMEEHLPEMLDVVALGMRSGLSFDASLKLYSEHFDTILAREFKLAQCQWSAGLERRDEALRKLAASYDSAIFSRLVETMIRSMRFGSSMVSNLEEDAREARSIYRSRKEERIAKAPVKMMIPTGTLILPAMLIMVLGPVLLELMGGAV